MNGNNELKVFSGNAHKELAINICDYIGISLGKNEVFRFSNDNIFARFHENIRHRDVFLVQPFAAPVNDHRTKLTAQKEMRQQSYQ